MGGPRVGDRSALTSRCQGVVSRPRPGGRKGRNSSERNAPGSASSKPSCLRSNSEFFPHGPNHLITSSSHTGRTTRSPLSLSPPLPPLSVAAVAVVVATIAVVTVVARAVATVAAAVATVADAADAIAAFTVVFATVAAFAVAAVAKTTAYDKGGDFWTDSIGQPPSRGPPPADSG